VTLTAHIAALRTGDPVAIAGILFDMDGTLVDSIPAVEAAWRLWAREHDVPEPSAALHGKTGRAVVTASPLALARHADAEHRLMEIEARPGQVVDPLPGARTLLRSLPSNRWGVVTSARRVVALSRLGGTDLPVPSVLITGDDVTNGKPHPEPFARGRGALPASPPHLPVVAVEDTANGALSAAQAGCLVIGVHGTEPLAALEECAHLVVESLQSLVVEAHGGVAHGGVVRLRIR